MSKKMQRSLLLLIVAVIGALTSAQAVQYASAPAAQINSSTGISSSQWYPVKKVIDGDTIDISIGASTTRVRLIGLDTPEVVDPRKPVQCFGKEASDEAKKILTGQSVRLETDPTQSLYDKYGRLLAYVYAPSNANPDGVLFNEFMISEGYGHEYTYDVPYKYQKEFKAAEKSAREAGKGLWAPGACAGQS